VLRFFQSLSIAVLLLASFAVNGAHGQCLLANPSFELGGTSGKVFGGWNQFGPVGSSSNATHGSVAARVSGPNLGGWDVAGYWQRLDCAPGESWSSRIFMLDAPAYLGPPEERRAE